MVNPDSPPEGLRVIDVGEFSRPYPSPFPLKGSAKLEKVQRRAHRLKAVDWFAERSSGGYWDTQ